MVREFRNEIELSAKSQVRVVSPNKKIDTKKAITTTIDSGSECSPKIGEIQMVVGADRSTRLKAISRHCLNPAGTRGAAFASKDWLIAGRQLREPSVPTKRMLSLPLLPSDPNNDSMIGEHLGLSEILASIFVEHARVRSGTGYFVDGSVAAAVREFLPQIEKSRERVLVGALFTPRKSDSSSKKAPASKKPKSKVSAVDPLEAVIRYTVGAGIRRYQVVNKIVKVDPDDIGSGVEEIRHLSPNLESGLGLPDLLRSNLLCVIESVATEGRADTDLSSRLQDSLHSALSLGATAALLYLSSGEFRIATETLIDLRTGETAPFLTRATFSHEVSESQCLACRGLGTVQGSLCLECYGSGLSERARQSELSNRSYPELLGFSLPDLQAWVHSSGLLDNRSGAILSSVLTTLIGGGLARLALRDRLRHLSTGEAYLLEAARIRLLDLCEIAVVACEPGDFVSQELLGPLCETLHALLEADNAIVITAPTDDGLRGGTRSRSLERADLASPTHTGHLADSNNTVEISFADLPTFIGRVRPSGKLFLVRNQVNALYGETGSGKTLLLRDILPTLLSVRRGRARGDSSAFSAAEYYDFSLRSHCVQVRDSRTVAEELGLISLLGELYASLPESRQGGFNSKSFHPTKSEQRCQSCDGRGSLFDDRALGSSGGLVCPECGGARFEPQIQAIKYDGRSIGEVLKLSVRTALGSFARRPEIFSTLRCADGVGLSNLPIGLFLSEQSLWVRVQLSLSRLLATDGRRGGCFLLDDPLESLELSAREFALERLRRMAENGTTILLGTRNGEICSVIRDSWQVSHGVKIARIDS